ncbi:T9SS type A sorting domain-containing protein [Hymenobacter psychrotolerans]|uniref:T9SS type A sorting domain-containing protein n=1 Tax=Hymenobacter psychrotolerans TaxID=344998 RepID=UPI000934F004|nr:T9SS type A sorting domain-containing protein [Hymenobacter psychrotolerans]
MFSRTLLLAATLSAGTLASQAQSTTAVQGFNGSNNNTTTGELGYDGEPTLRSTPTSASDQPASANVYTSPGSSWAVTDATESVLLRPRYFTNFTGNYIQLRVGAFSLNGRGNGLDDVDQVQVYVSVNNSPTYYYTARINGRNNSTWNFSSETATTVGYDGDNNPAIIQPGNAGNGRDYTGDGFSNVRINLPGGTSQVRVYIVANSGPNELWAIDDITIGSNSPLPVELKSFTADATAKGTQVRWSTASEKDNAGFEVQRGASSDKFETIARIAGHGTTTQARSYEWLDARPLAGVSYYRLRQTDTDGTETFSPVVAVKSGSKAAAFYPNPTTGSVVLAPELGAVRYRILNALGQALQSGESSGGSTIDVRALQAGAYFLELQTASGRQVQRFLREM